MKNTTKLVGLSRDKSITGNAVNPPIVKASTMLFESMQSISKVNTFNNPYQDYYGRRGTTTTFALRQALCELDNAEGCFLFSCGTAAITSSLLSFLSAGDHLLMVDNAYQPTRQFCLTTLKRFGIETTFYNPLIGAELADLIQQNTKVIYLESPGSLTMEAQDIQTIVNIAQQHNVVTMIDNTYATPLNFKPLDAGIDISIQSATKYICGTSDVMLGVATANEKTWKILDKNAYELGQSASPDDCYAALKGLRTMDIRLRQHSENALKIAQWLDKQEEVDKVFHPSLTSCPGHEYFKRDVQSPSGLFSFTLQPHFSKQQAYALVDKLKHFKIGFSWGGFESLALVIDGLENIRTIEPQALKLKNTENETNELIRLNIGLEAAEDLIDDLQTGLQRLHD